jgi:hypothetical protein
LKVEQARLERQHEELKRANMAAIAKFDEKESKRMSAFDA